MSTDPIRARLDEIADPRRSGDVNRAAGPIAALRAVIELHVPSYGGGTNEVCSECGAGSGCGMTVGSYDCFDRAHQHWPCPTVHAIAEALGVDSGGR